MLQTTCLTELPDVAPCNGTVRLPPPCVESPSSGGSKERRDQNPTNKCRTLAPVLLFIGALLMGGLCVPFFLHSAPATHQQRLEVIRRILTEVPLIDGLVCIQINIYYQLIIYLLLLIIC